MPRRSSALGAHYSSFRAGTAGAGAAGPRRGTRLPAAPPREHSTNPLGRHFSSCRPGNRRRQPNVTWGRRSQSWDAPARSILGGKAGPVGDPAVRIAGVGNEAGVCWWVESAGHLLRGGFPVFLSTTSPFVHSTDIMPSSGDEPTELNT